MTRPTATLLFVACLGFAPLSGAATPPGTNPVLGPTPAPVTLEYFTMVGCSSCRKFERDVLPTLLPEVEAGRLRVILRDLSPERARHVPRTVALHCLPIGPDYLERRRALVKAPAEAVGETPACRNPAVAQEVLQANTAAFVAHGFVGTPAFILTHYDGKEVLARDTWSGKTSVDDWLDRLDELLARSARP